MLTIAHSRTGLILATPLELTAHEDLFRSLPQIN